ncbi:polyketide cyclase/dehydrase/lipid transport protein [Streptomyces sp. SLBN-118]|uniref:type II toxin-antitoxin system RatA family toxin n=1 Tax=Streptomyces sp. SLBN-118 TaxID=2768454 RepID=UPI001151F7DF|nr:SRPBCC family protein [Streptomyces sp. SLBN-118]TQK51140.1 polyketide cyclase/dehydrase/lipid transport protein [Streptomyces sp. SLBN-118]
MPEIQAEAVTEGLTPEELWSLVKDGEGIASRAGHVVDVRTVPSESRQYRTTAWTVLLNGSEVSWVQREFAEEGPRLRFEQVSGDLEELTGEWSVDSAPGGSRLALSIAFELGIDGLAPLLEPIWAQSFQAHVDALLRAVTADTT